MATQVVWYKRDLRVADHSPLFEAALHGPVIPLYIIEPDLLAEPDYSQRHYLFTRQCLLELRKRLAALGMPLVVRTGPALAVLEALHAETTFERLWAHAETGNNFTYQRDIAVRAWAKTHSIPFVEYPNGGVVRGLRDRDVWARIWHERMDKPLLPTPKRLQPVPIEPQRIPESDELGLQADGIQTLQAGGERAAHALLTSFLTQRGANYHRQMSSPVTAFEACSRLSPHLAYGTISVKQVYQQLQDQQRQTMPRTSWQTALNAFNSRIHWRDHFIQKLEGEPPIEFHTFHSAYENLRDQPSASADAHSKYVAWCTGRTGYPLVDACMRALQATGYLNFRMRALVVSFASYSLWLGWRATGLHLARLFTDYEPGIHWSQMQMQSGTTGINTLRVYNPTKQAQQHDPDGVFIARWLPELEQVPKAFLQTPWLMPRATQQAVGCVIGVDYPAPIVDHESAARVARDRLWALRQQPAVQAEAARVRHKHGSRQPSRNSTRSTAKRPPEKAVQQQELLL